MSTEPEAGAGTPANDANPAQAALTELLAAHGLSGEDYKGWLLPHGQPPGIHAHWAPGSHGHQLIGMLSVALRMADRREVIENFAGLGEGLNGLHDALASFAQGDLHAMLGAVWGLRGPDIPEPLRWTIQGQAYDVFAGPWQLRNDAPLPDEIDAHLRAWIELEPLDQELHWYRFFVSQFQGKLGIETLKDNELWTPGQHLAELDWPQTEAFYSARNILMLRRVA
jgi:hypothetical protein